MSPDNIRAYYTALGIDLPEWSTREAPARCFANPDAHKNNDRTPSCSVNLDSGAWCCHGCGACGGAYDAALAKGHSPRSAIELMIAHGLTERRAAHLSAGAQRRATPTPRHHATRPISPVAAAPRRPEFTIAEGDVARWAQILARRPALLQALRHNRGWTLAAITELELGLDQLCQRITIPIRDHHGVLQGLLRYDPSPDRCGPKMRAAPGTRLGLIPHPAREPSPRILLVEGPPDMLAARSHRLPAIAVPGTSAWRQAWADQLAGRHVTVIMDADTAGRNAAERISADLSGLATVNVIDLAPARDDGYDLTDRLLERRHTQLAAHPAQLAQRPPGITRHALGPHLEHHARSRTR